jgi:hypothetical protein
LNSLRIRAVKLSEQYGAGTEYLHAVQISQDGLVWWTINRFQKPEEAIEAAKILVEFATANQIVKATNVLWRGNL